ncbi:MAG: AMP-binding protein [Streptosporangiales bacterium]|nr:AMP-binding protein [Streptosporangiales bacterium]
MAGRTRRRTNRRTREVTIVGSLIGEMVERTARQDPDRIAVTAVGGPSVSYRSLESRTNRLANALHGKGLRPGDRIALWLDDQTECVEAYVAASKASLTAVPVGKALASAEAGYILRDVGARGLFVSDGVADRVDDALADVDLALTIATGEERPAAAERYADLLAYGHDTVPEAVRPAPPPFVGYTSGTTGFPKGVVIGERGVREIVAMSALARRLPLRSVGVMTASLSFPAIVPADIFTHLFVGGTIVILGRWDAEKALRAISDERANYVYLPSPVIREFAEAADRDRDSWATLVTVMHSGSKAPSGRVRELVEIIGDRWTEIWGMMENSGGPVTATTRDDLLALRAADIYESVGLPLPQCEVTVVAPDGQPLPRGSDHVGELWLRSPAIMEGYWERPDAFAAALADGWYHSGDLGWMDEAGYIYIVDRRADLIVSGGSNVYPSELERVISDCPGVREVAVVGIPHERWGRTPVAVVVREPGATVDEAAVVAHCRRYLAGYKRPTSVLFTDALPKNASNKVVRTAVADWAERSVQRRG